MTLMVSIYYWCNWQYLYVKWYFYQNENNTDIFLEQTHSVSSSPSMVRLSLLFSLVLSLSSPLVAGDGVWTTDCRLLATQRLDPIGTELLGPAGFVKLGCSGSGSRIFDPHSHSHFLAVQNSSIGDLVTQSLTHSLTNGTFTFDITEWP